VSALINSVEHAFATAASDTVNVAKFVETSVLPVLKSAQANESSIEAVTSLTAANGSHLKDTIHRHLKEGWHLYYRGGPYVTVFDAALIGGAIVIAVVFVLAFAWRKKKEW
jgi:hypothetical protein